MADPLDGIRVDRVELGLDAFGVELGAVGEVARAALEALIVLAEEALDRGHDDIALKALTVAERGAAVLSALEPPQAKPPD